MNRIGMLKFGKSEVSARTFDVMNDINLFVRKSQNVWVHFSLWFLQGICKVIS